MRRGVLPAEDTPPSYTGTKNGVTRPQVCLNATGPRFVICML